ncbi:purine-binding chemotaxis protein CheW [Kineosporia sp. J2-2]|uniref:Purine-binding chemotaxis protein CheW n=1 Tax=Kineosporia corallincola TaxID=2835133 RepID=A0ABS5TS46_9ACTN|nr:chemotaxis protein CheW [Kineosporia corallincola]MBT0773612.1 purine-binding chemotaxis protein CheW [Kineosporia corallincola]
MKPGVDQGVRGVSLLVCGTGGKTFAVPLGAVRETLRPLPVSPVPGMPGFVLGVARVRGSAVPVVDAGVLTGGRPVEATRWITLSADAHRSVALAVAAVTGIRTLPMSDLEQLPPLLGGEGPQLFSGIASRDGEFLLALEASHLVPDGLWDRLAGVTSS